MQLNTLQQLMIMPWTWLGPKRVVEGKKTHWELRIRELPDFLVAGRTEEEVRKEAAAALEAFLASYVDAGEVPPLPSIQQWRFYVMGSQLGDDLLVSGVEKLFAGSTDLVTK
jgi:predicted RNase H-like HicB family nuclease